MNDKAMNENQKEKLGRLVVFAIQKSPPLLLLLRSCLGL
jgi:hypothetical protein